jgi:hypothetical protein
MTREAMKFVPRHHLSLSKALVAIQLIASSSIEAASALFEAEVVSALLEAIRVVEGPLQTDAVRALVAVVGSSAEVATEAIEIGAISALFQSLAVIDEAQGEEALSAVETLAKLSPIEALDAVFSELEEIISFCPTHILDRVFCSRLRAIGKLLALYVQDKSNTSLLYWVLSHFSTLVKARSRDCESPHVLYSTVETLVFVLRSYTDTGNLPTSAKVPSSWFNGVRKGDQEYWRSLLYDLSWLPALPKAPLHGHRIRVQVLTALAHFVSLNFMSVFTRVAFREETMGHLATTTEFVDQFLHPAHTDSYTLEYLSMQEWVDSGFFLKDSLLPPSLTAAKEEIKRDIEEAFKVTVG